MPKYYDAARNRATQKYIRENLEEVRFRVRKGERDKVKQEAQRCGQSLTQYLIQAVNERAGRQLLTPSGTEDGEET